MISLLHTQASAHDINITGIGRVFLDETSPGAYSLSIVDQVAPIPDDAEVLPDRCSSLVPYNSAYNFSCRPSLNISDELLLPWQLEGVVIVANWQGAEPISGFFRGNGNHITVPLSELSAESTDFLNLAHRYAILGVEHILFGLDHLLFVVGILLLHVSPWSLIQTLTAFTVAHSITLGSTVLGFVRLSSAPVEILIAVSIAFLARESLSKAGTHATWASRYPWTVAFAFGLFHGFGFAGALGSIGLRNEDIPSALLFFNLGIEIGQILFILPCVAFFWILAKVSNKSVSNARTAVAYGLGSVAMFWVFERIPAIFSSPLV